MLTLIKLEFKKNNIRTYVIASAIITIVMLGLIYTFAYAPHVEPHDEDIEMLMGYKNLILLFSVLNMAIFCILSSVMYSRFIIEEYAGKRMILLFSYPISPRKIFISKITIVSVFTAVAMTISNIIVLSIFGISETMFPLVDDKMTIHIIIWALKITTIMVMLAIGLGFVSVGIGFIKKSIPATITSAVILCSLLCNIIIAIFSYSISVLVLMLVIAIIIVPGIIVITTLSNKVNCMEVE